MARDFAKKAAPKKRGASKKAGQSAVSPMVWLLTGIFIGGLIVGLGYLKLKAPTPNKPEATAAAKPKETATEKVRSAQKDDDDVPVYNVHDALTNKEVTIPAEDLKPSEELDKYVYLMPCGSFRESSRAEELKATIAMTGNTSSINPVQSNGETWYRVELGPFSRKRKAENIRHRLQDNGIHDCRIIPRLKTSN